MRSSTGTAVSAPTSKIALSADPGSADNSIIARRSAAEPTGLWCAARMTKL